MKAILAVVFFFCSSAFGADIDVPLQQSKPTIRSEMKRGNDAEVNCTLSNYGEPRAMRTCLSNVISRNRQQNTLSDPFVVALYFQAWQGAISDMNVARQYGNQRQFEEAADSIYLILKDYQKGTNITIQMVCDSLNFSPSACVKWTKTDAEWAARLLKK